MGLLCGAMPIGLCRRRRHRSRSVAAAASFYLSAIAAAAVVVAARQARFRAAVSATTRGPHWARVAGCGRDFLIGAVLLYGYVYTAYKYGNPLFGRNDF